MRRLLPVLCSVTLLFGVVACGSDDDASPGMNQVQVLGSHNSYHLRPAPEVLDGIAALVSQEEADALDYEHRPLTEQLEEFGIRQFEIDVYADPDGGRFSQRPAAELVGLPVDSGEPALDEPGFKVIHQVDVDFGTTCLTFVDCLTEIDAWSVDHPDHEPIMIMIEAKQDSIEEATDGAITSESLGVELTETVTFDRATFDALEAEILSVFDQDSIITPDDIRGDAATLEEAVLEGDAWPTMDEAAGKVLFSLVDTGTTRDVYVGDATSLEGRLLFTSSEEGRPDAAFIRVDDPVAEGDRIRSLVAAGYLVRTRTDTSGVDAPAGDTTRRDAAFASGAQYLSTDYYVVEPMLDSGYLVELPGGGVVRCNPVNAPDDCEV
ncbi:phosphatidylinositol-specific phospholipase C1-like protein [Actinospongicola halichondriae]|uniref:phosphatidylinositol-specific phospholipase C1-like protein n=1 Tax=Actinospongicola halichondriae TaxID=3236844 RepID=UPI003D4D492A